MAPHIIKLRTASIYAFVITAFIGLALPLCVIYGCSQELIDGTIVPVMEKPPVTFTIKVDNAAGGTVTVNPAQVSYKINDYVKVTATPDEGYAFTGWSGTASGNANPLLVTVSKNEWIIPVFTAVQVPTVPPPVTFTVKVDKVAGGTAGINPAQVSYGKDDYVKVTATPDAGYAFTGWSGTASGNANPLLVTVSKNEWIIPVFTAVQVPTVPPPVTYAIKIDNVTGGTASLNPAQVSYSKDDYVKVTATPDAGYAFTG